MSNPPTDPTGYDLTQLSHRSRHDGGLAWEAVRAGSRTLRHNLRVIADKRLIDSLTDDQQAAMWFIARAYAIITQGLGARTFDPAAVRGGGGNIEYGANAIAEYFRWATRVQRAKLDHAMAMDVIAFGHSLRDVDRNRRQQNGTCKANLLACLDLCC